ncbi:TauD/TfdA family dioxygenase [Undibacterium sp. SXout7W]|uniref:TauD/TfdA family dioxygenase n=1 Tax=Undibacterium sp. SXout7W TaxID=3413049 RepID=UPI003BF2509E
MTQILQNLAKLNAYEWIQRRQGKIPSIFGRTQVPPLALAQVVAGISGYGIVRGIMKEFLSTLPPTGASGDRPERSEWGLEWAILRLASSIGCDILGYPGEKKGEYIHQVIPVAGREESRSNEGANLFEAHMEAPHLPEPPDLIMITYLKNEEKGPTAIWPLEVFLEVMTPQELDIAFQPRFCVEMGESWGVRETFNYPILERNELGEMKLRLDLTSMTGADEEAQRLLDKLFKHCVTEDGQLRNCLSLLMEPGDVLLFDNRKNCHGRVSIPKVDIAPEDRRWLQRVYLRRLQAI